MVMSETHSEKRKFGKAGESSANKKARREVSKKYGKFTEDYIPDGVFPIGDDVFVFASTYYDSVLLLVFTASLKFSLDNTSDTTRLPVINTSFPIVFPPFTKKGKAALSNRRNIPPIP
ncbi:hypothetical protein TNCV_1194431 [Trichonephila clavipes]|nr:hypothetical protein TNCV_1194431 [Trichonephila clavipes]